MRAFLAVDDGESLLGERHRAAGAKHAQPRPIVVRSVARANSPTDPGAGWIPKELEVSVVGIDRRAEQNQPAVLAASGVGRRMLAHPASLSQSRFHLDRLRRCRPHANPYHGREHHHRD